MIRECYEQSYIYKIKSSRSTNSDKTRESCLLKRDESGAVIQLGTNKSFSITLPESSVLKRLIEAKGEVVCKKDLVTEGWGNPEAIGPNSLPVAITNLRKILDLIDIKIVNTPRKGYHLEFEEVMDMAEEEDKTNTVLPPERPNQPLPGCGIARKTRIVYNFGLLFGWSALLYSLMYVYFSWVSVDCLEIDLSEVCFIKGDSLPTQPINGKSGYYYYSSHSGLIEVQL